MGRKASIDRLTGSNHASESEGFNSTVEVERAQASHQQALRAADALRRSGMEDASPDTINAIEEVIPAFGELRGNWNRYNTVIYEIQDDPDATDEDRQLSYADLKDEVLPKAAETARKIRAQVEESRAKLNRYIFGVNALDGPKGSSAESYRDALLRAKGASTEELSELADLAEMTGDRERLKAVAAVADRRGNKEIVCRYLKGSEKLLDTYAIRSALPTDATLDILLHAYTPQTINKDQLRPSAIAVERRKAKEREQNYRRAAAFHR